MSAGRQRHEDDVPAHCVEGREDRRRVAPHADHAADLPVGDRAGSIRGPRQSCASGVPAGLAQPRVGDAGRRGLAAERGREVGRRRADQAARRGVVGRQDAPVGPADLDPQDLARSDERCQSPLERGLALAASGRPVPDRPGDRLPVTNRRTSAASAPTVVLSVVAERSAETIAVWATAVKPTMTRKIP